MAADAITDFLDDGEIEKRPPVDVAHFDLLEELQQRGKAPVGLWPRSRFAALINSEIMRCTTTKTALQPRSSPMTELFLGHFDIVPREVRDERFISKRDAVLGNFEERIIAYSEEQAKKEGERCMSCGMCFRMRQLCDLLPTGR